jgi:phospholipase/carboxylesterase
MVMSAWYDIVSMEIERVIDTKQIMEPSAAVGELIEQEVARGIPHEKIFIAGFSQGGAVAYEAVLSYPKELGGLIVLSTYFATGKTIAFSDANTQLPIFIGHGNIVDVSLGQEANDALSQLDFHPEHHTYLIAHSVCMEEIAAISLWLQKQLKN